MLNRRIAQLLAASVLTLATASAAAEVYRWVDENGVVNYSQHKPEGKTAQSVDPRATKPASDAPTAEPERPATKLTDEQQRMFDELKAKEAERQAQIAEIRRDNCEKSRSVLDRLMATDRIRVKGADGQERIIGEDERQSRITEAQRGIATNCESS